MSVKLVARDDASFTAANFRHSVYTYYYNVIGEESKMRYLFLYKDVEFLTTIFIYKQLLKRLQYAPMFNIYNKPIIPTYYSVTDCHTFGSGLLSIAL